MQLNLRRLLGAKRQTAICREGVYYLLVLAFVSCGALLRDINLLVVMAGMLVGPLLYNWRAVVVALRELRVERKVPEAICAGEPLTVALALSNGQGRAARRMLVVEDLIQHDPPGPRDERRRPAVLFPLVPAGETRHATYTGRLDRRGRYRFGPLTLSTRFPLGLVRRIVQIERQDALLVYPRLGRLSLKWSHLRRDRLVGSQPMRRQRGTRDAEFFGLRPWRSGDSQRDIHWRTTARRGEVMVRQFEQQRDEDLLLLVDLWQSDAPDAAELERVEKTVGFAATAVVDLCRRGGGQLALGVVGADKSFARGVASQGLRGELMETLALAAAGSKHRLADLLSEALEAAGPGTMTVIVSTRPASLADAELSSELAARLGGSQVVTIDAGGEELNDYFQWE